jgi:hypothetical protein
MPALSGKPTQRATKTMPSVSTPMAGYHAHGKTAGTIVSKPAFSGAQVCHIDLENGSEFVGDVSIGCTSGSGCVNLKHPNGDYFEFTQVNEAGATPCIQA